MSRTVRYFKLMYIVTGILLSNEAICETVDQIQIAPRLAPNLELKEKIHQQTMKNANQNLQVSEKKTTVGKRWYQKLFIYRLLHRIHSLLWLQWRVFSLRSLLNYFVECATSLICRTFIINSDCDVIYK